MAQFTELVFLLSCTVMFPGETPDALDYSLYDRFSSLFRMASLLVEANHHANGYDVEFLEDLDPKFVCGICSKALRNPLQTPCGHRHCEACLAPFLR